MPYHGKEGKEKMTDEERLKEHAKQHKGGMRSKHMRNMVKFMKEGDSFAKAHKKAMAEDKKGEGVFTETKGTIKEGALRKALKMEDKDKLNKTVINKMLKTKNGEMFEYKGNSFKMTALMRKRLQLALNMITK